MPSDQLLLLVADTRLLPIAERVAERDLSELFESVSQY